MINGYKVKIIPSVYLDLQIIYDYISNILKSSENADNTINAIENKIKDLCNVPKRGMEYPNEPWKTKGLRMVFLNNYTIFYYVFDDDNIVKVVKVAYSKMDFNSLLKKFDEEQNNQR